MLKKTVRNSTLAI